MTIGILGSGSIGGALGVLWTRAGHDVFFSSRHPDRLGALAEQAGPPAHAVLFLLTNSYVTGAVLPVDGGLLVS